MFLQEAQGISKICPGSINHTMGKVKKLDSSINDGKAYGDKGIDTASNYAI